MQPDVTSLTFLEVLLWLWVSFHGSEACLAFPSAMKMLCVFHFELSQDSLTLAGLKY